MVRVSGIIFFGELFWLWRWYVIEFNVRVLFVVVVCVRCVGWVGVNYYFGWGYRNGQFEYVVGVDRLIIIGWWVLFGIVVYLIKICG